MIEVIIEEKRLYEKRRGYKRRGYKRRGYKRRGYSRRETVIREAVIRKGTMRVIVPGLTSVTGIHCSAVTEMFLKSFVASNFLSGTINCA